VRLAFSVAAHLDPGNSGLDEVLAVGEWLFKRSGLGKDGRLCQRGRTVLCVSHNMAVIQTLANEELPG